MLIILLIKNRQKKRHNALIFFGARSDPRNAGKKLLNNREQTHTISSFTDAPPQCGEEQVKQRTANPYHKLVPYRYRL